MASCRSSFRHLEVRCAVSSNPRTDWSAVGMTSVPPRLTLRGRLASARQVTEAELQAESNNGSGSWFPALRRITPHIGANYPKAVPFAQTRFKLVTHA